MFPRHDWKSKTKAQFFSSRYSELDVKESQKITLVQIYEIAKLLFLQSFSHLLASNFEIISNRIKILGT